jgi:dephospho-CoA kinase
MPYAPCLSKLEKDIDILFMTKKLRVAITGGIGSGKSLVSSIFEKAGYKVIKTDEIAKELMESNDQVKKKLIKSFGTKVYSDGILNTKYLADEIFNNEEKLSVVNGIVHPPTFKMIESLYKKFFENNDIVFVESALVFEAKMSRMFDHIILIYSDEITRIKRVVQRDNTTEEKVKSRMQYQINDEQKKDIAHITIENNSTIEELEKRCKFIIDILNALLVTTPESLEHSA